MINDKDLVVDPRFFIAFEQYNSRLGHVQLLPKRGPHQNEMVNFRYDAVLYAREGFELQDRLPWKPWAEDQFTASAIHEHLATIQPQTLALTGVPNTRILMETTALSLCETSQEHFPSIADIKLASAQAAEQGIDPDVLWQLGEALDYDVELSWAGSAPEGSFDVIFQRRDVSDPEHRLVVFPGVKESLAPNWRQYANDPQLQGLKRILTPELRDRLSKTLPDYMLPSAFIFLDAFPLTPNGKLDRKALPAIDGRRTNFEGYYAPPESESERTLAELWGRLLGVDRVGRNDNFFELGGHSLLAIRLISQVREQCNVELPLVNLFEAPILRDLATRLEDAQAGSSGPGMPAIVAVGRAEPLPLSFAQQRLWIIDQLEPGNTSYNIPMAVRLTGPLDVEALQRSLNAVLERHEVLRTHFPMLTQSRYRSFRPSPSCR